MQHSFDINIAKEIGIQPAIIFENLFFWIEKNRVNNKHYYDDHYWTYNSKKAFTELFPYMTERQIDYAIKKLIDAGYVITGNYNNISYDRTLWYAITKKGYSILQNCKMEDTNLVNGNNKNVEPIPDINTNINTNNKKKNRKENTFIPPSFAEVQNYVDEKGYGIDVDYFYRYYSAGNWTDAEGKQVKNWKQRIVTWEKRRKEKQQNRGREEITYEKV